LIKQILNQTGEKKVKKKRVKLKQEKGNYGPLGPVSAGPGGEKSKPGKTDNKETRGEKTYTGNIKKYRAWGT